jgi:tetratricopeptide (TPR) repeat protein
MIRRDYILRMIQEFIQMLSQIQALKKRERWQEAAGAADEASKWLTGLDADSVTRLTETELLAKLIPGETTQAVHDKMLMLAALLKEAGDVATARDRPEQGRACYLKGLDLLLDALSRGEASEYPDFVPGVGVFVASLRDSPLPFRSCALLMQHYERTGQYAKAEDELFAMLDEQPDNSEIIKFGTAFYERLQGQSDAALAFGNLPRSEVETGLAGLRKR